MDELTKALWEMRQHMISLCVLYKLDVWPQVPGYECLMKGIASTAGIDEDILWNWFENTCESVEQLQEFVEFHKAN